MKIWKPIAHSTDLWSKDNLSCHTHRAALRSAEITALRAPKVGVKGSAWGHTMTRERPALRKPEPRQVSGTFALMGGPPLWRVGRELSPSQQAESHLPRTTSLQVALLRAARSSSEEQGQLGIVLPSQHPHRRSWPGAPVKGIGEWRPML